MQSNSWLKLALLSFIAVIVLVGALAFVSPGGITANNAILYHNNMQMQPGYGMNGGYMATGPMGNMNMTMPINNMGYYNYGYNQMQQRPMGMGMRGMGHMGM